MLQRSFMRHSIYVVVILFLSVSSIRLYAQDERLLQDSIRLPKSPDKEFLLSPQLDNHKSWLDFDNTLPSLPVSAKPKKKVRLTLNPYSSNRLFDWDPIYQCKLVKKADGSWQPEGTRTETISPNLLTPTKRENEFVPPPTSISTDLMYIFTKEFWQFQRRKNKKRLGKVLETYATD